MWDRYEFKAGDRVAGTDGAWAEVLSAKGGRRLRVRYTGEGAHPSRAGTEVEIGVNDVASVSPAPYDGAAEWGERVTAVLHRVPETGDFEGGFEAVTMGGVPHNVIVTGSDPETAAGALENLLAGLRAFGFSGTLAVDDATYMGGVQRYEVEV